MSGMAVSDTSEMPTEPTVALLVAGLFAVRFVAAVVVMYRFPPITRTRDRYPPVRPIGHTEFEAQMAVVTVIVAAFGGCCLLAVD